MAESMSRVRALIACGHWDEHLAFYGRLDHERNHSLMPIAMAA